MSPGTTDARRVATMSAAGGTVTAGSARLPTMTGCTNSTATWWAWKDQLGDAHHMVAPAENRRARARDARARSWATPCTSAVTVTVSCQPRFQCRTGRSIGNQKFHLKSVSGRCSVHLSVENTGCETLTVELRRSGWQTSGRGGQPSVFNVADP